MKKMTIDDVAKKAGVSKSTVSQFLNKRYKYMSEETRNKIAAVIEELNYRPNGLARGLKQNRTYTVGVIVADINYSLSIQCIRAIENELQLRDIQVIICNADENPDKESRYIETLLARQVDGLIVFPTGDDVTRYVPLTESRYPLVFMDRLIDGISTQSLLLDNELAIKAAVREFAEAGHTRVALLTLPLGPYAVTPRRERIAGFRRAAGEAGLQWNDAYICSAAREDMGAALDSLLSMEEPPTALLAANDIALGEALKYANRKGLKIPDDLSVIGIDGAEIAAVYNPEITTIRQPAYEMGMQAAKIILGGIEEGGSPVPITYRFSPALQPGHSVRQLT
ncbi:LacI family DNA-binding transcriptional regulator [Paenibacillus sp. HN-1]|uniref:LacI family DNA-binding transcriptional regulator n=1 Tax=Paenibacillus TaxID=44249 RepID=UPI001CA9518A|nr:MULTISPECIES: LacI family DNA-binding transcriptional regulator [Paenibacillus]MBY9079493.1 LacI family DNA-binding transcriptional regulator [Paenibacillus sp. CGMCC 1.18879]MBY9085582.1 LacI family DNA-binding transcriptional regulator [Paenibacillus sinensis]